MLGRHRTCGRGRSSAKDAAASLHLRWPEARAQRGVAHQIGGEAQHEVWRADVSTLHDDDSSLRVDASRGCRMHFAKTVKDAYRLGLLLHPPCPRGVEYRIANIGTALLLYVSARLTLNRRSLRAQIQISGAGKQQLGVRVRFLIACGAASVGDGSQLFQDVAHATPLPAMALSAAKAVRMVWPSSGP